MPKKKKPVVQTKPTPLSPRFSRRTIALLTIGLVLLVTPLLYSVHQSLQLRFFVPVVPVVTSKQTAAVPTGITIPAVGITLPVEQTRIINNTWEVSTRGVSHLAISANPTESGPIIMYDHNTNTRLGPIRWLKQGDEIRINTADNTVHRYKVVETKVVDPDEMSVFFERKTETLYIYTCDGFADLKRFIVIAEPTKTASSTDH